MADNSDLSAVQKARALAELMDAASDSYSYDANARVELSGDARTWALVSIAESLERLASVVSEDRDGGHYLDVAR